MIDDAMQDVIVGDVLIDRSTTGAERPWRGKRRATELLALAYADVDTHKAQRLSSCATQLGFALCEGGCKRLVAANFCRVRLCPMCTWRRGLKVYAQARSVVEHIHGYAYLFVTLTIRNVSGGELSAAIDGLFEAWDRFSRRKRIARAWCGGMRTAEITHNVDPRSKDYDTYHPHLHVLVAVRRGYFSGRSYITQAEYTALWRAAARIDYDPIVHVERCKSTTAAALAECCKYSVKDADYILPDDWDLTVDTVRILDAALHRRRLVSWFGIFSDVRRELALDDAEDGDLIAVGDDDVGADELGRVYYAWVGGYTQQYYRRRD